MSSICLAFQHGRRALLLGRNNRQCLNHWRSRSCELFQPHSRSFAITFASLQDQNNNWNRHQISHDKRPRLHRSLSTSAAESSANTTDLVELNKRLVECADRGDASQADDILIIMENKASEKEIDVDSYTAVLDAWLKHQDDAYQNMDGDARTHEMRHSAERANAILTRMQNEKNEGELKSFSIRPTSHHYDAVLAAWSRVCVVGGSSKETKGAPQRAQRVLEQMESQSLVPSSGVLPTIESYNLVMEAWGASGEHLRASMAQAIYHKLVEANDIEPNPDTYRIMIRAWCNSKQKRAAFNAMGHLMKMQEGLKAGIEEMEPSQEDSHLVLEAWTRAEGKLGYRRAISLLRLMDDLYISRSTEIRPNETSFRLVLETLAHNSVAVPDLGQLVDKVLEQMEERLMIPDTACFSAAIETLKNSALLEESSSPHSDAERAHELLHQMKKTFHRTSTIVVKPCSKHYNMVIQAWSVCAEDGAADKAEMLLSQMEKAFQAGDEDLEPNSDSYVWTMDALAKCDSIDKVDRALNAFQRMKEQHKSGNESAKPSVDSCNAMMSVCASATRGDATSQKAALQTAFAVLTELSNAEEGDGPNSTTYKILLEACSNLLPPGKEQIRALKRVFQNCCRAGLVDKDVLEKFKEEAPSELYNKLVVAAGVKEDSGKMVPEEWTRNLAYRVLTVEGHKPPPLSIEGLFVFTPALYENKMRNLRKRKNQRLLRAGRMRR